MLLEKEMKLADVINHDYSLIPVISRFGIMLGFGDSSIDSICAKEKINIDFFLTILNTFHDPQYFDEKYLQGFSASLLIDYLQKAHIYYLQNKVPEIEALINDMALNGEVDDASHKILQKFFKEYKEEFIKHIEKEENYVYPYVNNLEEAINNNIPDKVPLRITNYSITSYEAEHESVEEKLMDLKNIIIKYLPASKMQQSRYNLLRELVALEKDLHDHAQMENLILVPKVVALEKQINSRK